MKASQPEPPAASAMAVIGRATDKNELEDFWMAKVSSLERQYDEHLRHLQLRLFEHHVDRKLVTRLRGDNAALNYQLEVSVEQKKGLRGQVKTLDASVRLKGREVLRVKSKLDSTLAKKEELRLALNSKNKALGDARKAQGQLTRKLSNMVRDRADLSAEVKETKVGLGVFQGRLRAEQLAKKGFAYTLSLVDTERRVATKGNLALLDTVANLVEDNGTKEEQLYRMQTDIHRVMRELQAEKDREARVQGQKELVHQELTTVQEELAVARAKAQLEERAARHWKEESGFRQALLEKAGNGQTGHESTALRGQMAECKRHIQILESKVKTFDAERNRLARQLEILPTLQKSLQNIISHNAKKRSRLMPANEDGDTDAGGHADGDAEEDSLLVHSSAKAPTRCRRSRCPVQNNPSPSLCLGYEKDIRKLRRGMIELEAQRKESARKANCLRLKLDNAAALETELFWREKAGCAIERENLAMRQLVGKLAADLGGGVGRGTGFLRKVLGVTGTGARAGACAVKLQEKLVQDTFKTQQKFIDSLKTGGSGPYYKAKNWNFGLEGQRSEFKVGSGSEAAELQEKIDRLRLETAALESKTEALKKLRPVGMVDAAAALVRQYPAAGVKGQSVDEKDVDVIEAHFIPEAELIASIDKQFSEQAAQAAAAALATSAEDSSEGSSSSSGKASDGVDSDADADADDEVEVGKLPGQGQGPDSHASSSPSEQLISADKNF